jgi:hypothetical protein
MSVIESLFAKETAERNTIPCFHHLRPRETISSAMGWPDGCNIMSRNDWGGCFGSGMNPIHENTYMMNR